MQSQKQQKLISSLLVNGALLILVLIWTLPTFGLLISSFRPPDAVRTTGWWTVFSEDAPLSERFTLRNYQQVLSGKDIESPDGTVLRASGDNLSRAFLNSVTVAIPATVIPILIAAFAAYAFA